LGLQTALASICYAVFEVSKLLPRLRAAFGEDVQAVQYQVSALNPNGTSVSLPSTFIYEPILKRKSPLDYDKERNPGYIDHKLEVSLQRANQTKLFFGRSMPNSQAEEQFNKLVAECSEEVANDPTILLIQDQVSRLKKSGAILLDDLKQVIEKPWNY
jgi:hypothetical protein